MGKSTVELGEFDFRQGGHKVSELTLEQQRKKIAPDCTGAWQAVIQTQHDLRRQSQDFSVHWGADYRGDVFIMSHESSGHDHVIARFPATLGHPLAGMINLPASHERACSEMRARAWRASRRRCLRNTAPSFASVSRLRALSAYWRKAARTNAERLRRREDVSVSLSRSFRVASSMAIVFI
mgnify:FL=1